MNLIPVVAGHRLRLDFWMRAGDDSLNPMLEVTLASFPGKNEDGWGIGLVGSGRYLKDHTPTHFDRDSA